MPRQYPDGDEHEAYDRALDEIARVFTTDWLVGESEEHPLRTLWKREDVLSTLELFSFGHALQIMNKINEQWVKGQIKIIKGKDMNNRRGAFFEIIGLSQFADSSYFLKPAPHSQAGFDATLQSSTNNVETRLSLKSYGRSKHDYDFESRSIQLESAILSMMGEARIHYAEFIIIFQGTSSPQAEDWDILHARIPALITRYKRANCHMNALRVPVQESFQGWFVKIRSSRPSNTLYAGKTSYQLLIIAPHHFNEIRNLYDKLDAAQANFTRHVPVQSTTNLIYVHVPLTISISQCEHWTEKYFAENPTATAHLVIFYQCVLVYNLKDDTRALNHVMSYVLNPNQVEPKDEYRVHFPIGYTSNDSRLIQLNDSSLPEISLDSSYLFQRGKYYKMAKEVKSGSISGEVSTLAPGVLEASVYKWTGKIMIFDGCFEQSDQLLIL